MLDIGLIDRALAGDGKAADDRRLLAVDSASVSDVLLAADTARIGLEAGATDVRLLAAYTLGVFVEQGPLSLAGIFEALRKAVKERWLSLRPDGDKKVSTTDGALARLFRSITNHIDVHEKMQDATFKAWLRVDHDSVGGPALLASSALRDALGAALVDLKDNREPRSTGALSELDARIRSHFDRFVAPKPAPARTPDPEPEAEPEEEAAAEEQPSSGQPSAEQPSSGQPPSEQPSSGQPRADERRAERASDPGPAARSIPVSAAFALFLRKIEAVPALLERDPERAAVVADDVRRTLKSFDPKVFFPEVLTPYLQFMAQSIDRIAPHWGAIGSPQWEALAELYQVDPDSFLDG